MNFGHRISHIAIAVHKTNFNLGVVYQYAQQFSAGIARSANNSCFYLF